MDGVLPSRVLPELDLATTAFWTSGEDGILRFEQCGRCATFLHPPTGRCYACHSTEVSLRPVSGRGVIYSFTVNHQQWIPASNPYVIVLIDLDEGTSDAPLRLTSNLVGTDPDEVAIGMPVEVFFIQCEDVWLPQFRRSPVDEET
jgi:uncharacterized OB-fold protein